MTVSLAQALGWRLDRHYLVSGAASVSDVVRRLVALPAWSGDPDLAVRRRLERPEPEALARALDDGDLVKTYAFRGATHLLTAEDAGIHLAIRGAGRQWERPGWQRHYDLQPQDWPALRAAVREALAGGPVTRAELVDAVTAQQRFRHLRPGLSDPSHTLLKPFAWQGDLCFGPARDGQPTYQAPQTSTRWAGLPEIDDAGRRAVISYLAGYGPTTRTQLHYWLVAGLSAGRRRLEAWLAGLLGDRVVEVEVGGRPMLHLQEHLEALSTQSPAGEVVLLPGYDQWVLGPGTADSDVVPAARRALVTRGANLVLLAGAVAGTWAIDRDTLTVSWFTKAGSPPRERVASEAERLAALIGHDLELVVTVS